MYEYGDQINLFADPMYQGYALTSLVSLFTLSRNNLLKSERKDFQSGNVFYVTYEYTFSDDNYPIKIIETTGDKISTQVGIWEIEYEE